MKPTSPILPWALCLVACVLMTFNSRAATGQNASFTGTVVDAKGAPVADATVEFYSYPRANSGSQDLELKSQTTSDSKGSFTVPPSDTAMTVTAKKVGLAVGWKYWNPAQGGFERALVLRASAPLAGTVLDENGQPVRDAEVAVLIAYTDGETGFGANVLAGKPARDGFSTRTAADGKFRIANFPAGTRASLIAVKAGKALRPMRNAPDGFPFRSGQEDIQLVMDPGGSIEGKLTVKETGQPIARANIVPQPLSGYFATGTQTIQSGADGVFRIPDLPAGSYRLMVMMASAAASEWVAESVTANVAAGQTTRDVTIQAIKGGLVEVTVISKRDRTPVDSVSVSAYSEAFQTASVSGSNGVALMRLPAGSFALSAFKQGWAQAQMPTTVQLGQTNRVRLELGSPFKVTGILRDPSGAPVAGAQIAILPNFGGQNADKKSDDNGRYEATWQQPNMMGGFQRQNMFLIARNVERNLVALRNIDETTTNLDLRLEPGLTVAARVQDPNGKPIAGAIASVMVSYENGSTSVGQPSRTDDQGRISVPALPMGKSYGIWISATGYGSVNNQDLGSQPGQTRLEFPVFTLKHANRKLAGKVLGTDGKPVAGAQVYFNGDGQPNVSAARSDAKGEFVFDGVCDGPLTVSANLNRSQGNVEAMAGDTNVVVRLTLNNITWDSEPTATITGTVLTPSGAPASGVHMMVTPSFGMLRDVTTDDKGQFSVGWSPQQRRQNTKFLLIARDLEHNLAVAAEIAEGTTNLDLRLEQGLAVSGVVEDDKGAPVRGANINLNLMAGNSGGLVDARTFNTDERGAFKIVALPQGQQYNVRVSANGFGTTMRSLRPTETRTDKIEMSALVIKRADLPLAGRVVGSDDKPIAGAQVMINGNGQPNNYNTRSDSSGYFSLKVTDGPLTISAFQSRSGGGPSESGNIQARGGDTNVLVKIGVRRAQARNPQTFTQVTRARPLKPQAWTWNSITSWPSRHKTATNVLAGLQIAVLAGAVGGIFWIKRRQPPS